MAIVDTFGAFVDAHIERIKGGFKNEKHIYQWRQTLGPAYCASIRGKKLNEITTDDVLGVLEPIWQVRRRSLLGRWLKLRFPDAAERALFMFCSIGAYKRQKSK